MAIIKEKLAFGIFKDGLRVKVAQLSLNNGVVSIQSLEETTLSSGKGAASMSPCVLFSSMSGKGASWAIPSASRNASA